MPYLKEAVLDLKSKRLTNFTVYGGRYFRAAQALGVSSATRLIVKFGSLKRHMVPRPNLSGKIRKFEGYLKSESSRINADIEKSENVPDNIGVEVDEPYADVAILTVLPEEHQAIREKIADLEMARLVPNHPNLCAWQVGKVACKGGAYSVAVGMIGRPGTKKVRWRL